MQNTHSNWKPSILSLTHQMSCKKKSYSVGLWLISYISWYLMVLDQYTVLLAGTWWYWVSISWYCLVLGSTGSSKGFFACIYWKKWRFGQVLYPSLTDSQTTEYRAAQFVSSLKFKKLISLRQEQDPATVLKSKLQSNGDHDMCGRTFRPPLPRVIPTPPASQWSDRLEGSRTPD